MCVAAQKGHGGEPLHVTHSAHRQQVFVPSDEGPRACAQGALEERIVVWISASPGVTCRMDHGRMLGEKHGPGIGQPGRFSSLQFRQQALILREWRVCSCVTPLLWL